MGQACGPSQSGWDPAEPSRYSLRAPRPRQARAGGGGGGGPALQASLAHPSPCRWAHRPLGKAQPARAGPGGRGGWLGPLRLSLGASWGDSGGRPGTLQPCPGWVRVPRMPPQELSGERPSWARVPQAQPSGLARTWEPRQLLEHRRAVCDSGQERPAGGFTEDGGVGGPTGVPAGWAGGTRV